MIEFKAFLGEHGGLHFACTNTSGDAVAEELLRLDQFAREITGVGLGGLTSIMTGAEEVNPMAILALIAGGHMGSQVCAERIELCTRDPRDPNDPAVNIFVGARLSEVTVAVRFFGPGEDDEGA